MQRCCQQEIIIFVLVKGNYYCNKSDLSFDQGANANQNEQTSKCAKYKTILLREPMSILHSSTQAPKARLRRPSSNPSISDSRRKQHILYLILSQIRSHKTNFNFRALGFPRLTIYRPGLLFLAKIKIATLSLFF